MAIPAYAQDVWMIPNRGQWEDSFDYRVNLQNGAMFIEEDGMSFMFTNWEKHAHEEKEIHSDVTQFQGVKASFLGAKTPSKSYERGKSAHYNNYFNSADQANWRSKVHGVNVVGYQNVYDNIDLVYRSGDGTLKYEFIVEPEANTDQIRLAYSGHDRITIDEEGNARILHHFGEIIESKPVAWALQGNQRMVVPVEFKLEGNILSYVFPKGYRSTDTLVIDPNLTFSTFSGSTADNWGFTAAPDGNGNLFGAGVVFNIGYPVTAGIYDPSFNGGKIDVAITKFNVDGTGLIYSTYYGGSESETPNSIVANSGGDLFVFGVTSSPDLPLSGAPFDNTYNGGPSLADSQTNSLGFTNGSDLYVARFSADGTALIAATYVGGTGNDGCNVSNLKFNYGDQFRGEIIVDASNNVYVSSMTESADFPVVLGSQGTLSGTQDAVLFKLNGTLSTMQWSSYFGGSGLETGNAIEISNSGVVYVAGGTTSTNLPVNGGHDQTANGSTDGYVARFNNINGSFLSGTYIGSNEYDQSYFVQIDLDDKVYVLGQSESDLGISPGQYGNPNSGQFIRKYTTNLNSLEWTTMIGASTGHVEISPTAFLVSDCYDIYLSGWGGQLNQNPNVSQAINSTTNGFPITTDAYQPTTNGSNFYIAVLGQDATTLKYGTFFGSLTTSFNHVDGGTSRFDKSGRIYHAVCGACGGNPNGFTTTPGTWSPNNQSGNCNMATFKFELSTIDAVVGNPDPIVCLPDPVIFNNNSANGNEFFWDFGDGNFSNDVNPSHQYPGPGVYDVTLVVSDSNGCFSPDSVYFQVNIGEFNGGIVPIPGPICPGETIQVEAYGGTSYLWSPAQYMDDPTSSTPNITLDQTTDFEVIISDSCGVDTVGVTVFVYDGNISVSNDTLICIGNSVQLFAMGGVSTQWSPATFLDDPNSATPLCTPDQNVTYTVDIVTSDGCALTDVVNISVYFQPPIPVMPDSVFLCAGQSVSINVSGGESYFWYPDDQIDDVNAPNIVLVTDHSQLYYCDMTNACGTVTDSLWVQVVGANIIAWNDTIICPGQTAVLNATGGVMYNWIPNSGLSTNYASQVYASPSTPTMYYVQGVNQYGCFGMDSVYVDLYPMAAIQTTPDVYALLGDNIQIGATTTTPGIITWYPTEFLSCVACPSPLANPDKDYYYVASYVDANGCSASDTVFIFYDPLLYVPNTFSPNGDEHNQLFKVVAGNIKSFELSIFDRWGELIFTSDEVTNKWDGTYNGYTCQDGTYTWKIKVLSLRDEERTYVGHVNLIR